MPLVGSYRYSKSGRAVRLAVQDPPRAWPAGPDSKDTCPAAPAPVVVLLTLPPLLRLRRDPRTVTAPASPLPAVPVPMVAPPARSRRVATMATRPPSPGPLVLVLILAPPRRRHGERAAGRVERAEDGSVGKAQLVGGAGVERGRDVDAGVGPEQDAGGIDEEDVPTRHCRANHPSPACPGTTSIETTPRDRGRWCRASDRSEGAQRGLRGGANDVGGAVPPIGSGSQPIGGTGRVTYQRPPARSPAPSGSRRSRPGSPGRRWWPGP